jgi:hypothetical protein
MTKPTVRLLIGSAMITAGAALIYTGTMSSRNRSLLGLTRKQTRLVKRQASKIRDAAAGRLLEVVDTGKAVYRQAAERIAG